MKRRLLIIAVFLLLGAVVNVAVAWGCALSLRFGGGDVDTWTLSGKVAPARLFAVYEKPGYRAVSTTLVPNQQDVDYFVDVRQYRIETPVPLGWLGEIRESDRLPHEMFPQSRFDAYGWPMRSLWCGFSFVLSPLPRHWTVSDFFGGVQLEPFVPPEGDPIWHRHHVLPVGAIAVGLAVNTVFYAALLWLLRLLIRARTLRRYLRLRRGLCPKCAYPMGESAVCTECGKALPSST